MKPFISFGVRVSKSLIFVRGSTLLTRLRVATYLEVWLGADLAVECGPAIGVVELQEDEGSSAAVLHEGVNVLEAKVLQLRLRGSLPLKGKDK